jgi:hypothetical protein
MNTKDKIWIPIFVIIMTPMEIGIVIVIKACLASMAPKERNSQEFRGPVTASGERLFSPGCAIKNRRYSARAVALPCEIQIPIGSMAAIFPFDRLGRNAIEYGVSAFHMEFSLAYGVRFSVASGHHLE